MIAIGRGGAKNRRRAFTMVEVAVTVLMLAVAMTTILHVLTWVAMERRAIERREWALEEAANLMERIAARPWKDVNAGAVKPLTLSEHLRGSLPDAELSIAVDEKAGPQLKRVAIRIRWRNQAGTWVAPVRITSWMSRREDR